MSKRAWFEDEEERRIVCGKRAVAKANEILSKEQRKLNFSGRGEMRKRGERVKSIQAAEQCASSVVAQWRTDPRVFDWYTTPSDGPMGKSRSAYINFKKYMQSKQDSQEEQQ